MALHPTAEVMIQLLTEAGMTFTLGAPERPNESETR